MEGAVTHSNIVHGAFLGVFARIAHGEVKGRFTAADVQAGEDDVLVVAAQRDTPDIEPRHGEPVQAEVGRPLCKVHWTL